MCVCVSDRVCAQRVRFGCAWRVACVACAQGVSRVCRVVLVDCGVSVVQVVGAGGGLCGVVVCRRTEISHGP